MEIECIFYDFDGVMTDNRALIDVEGNEYVFINRSDGYAISKIRECGIKQVIVSTEINRVVEARGKKLNIDVIHGVDDKASIITEYCHENNIDLAQVVFIGNDLNDVSAMKIVGLKCAPQDAEEEVLNLADWISEKKGGFGVVRDFYRHWIERNI